MAKICREDIAKLTRAKEMTLLSIEKLKRTIGNKQKRLEDALRNRRKEEVCVSVFPRVRTDARRLTSATFHIFTSRTVFFLAVRRFVVSRRILRL